MFQNIDFNYNEKEMCFFKTKNYIVGQPFSAKTIKLPYQLSPKPQNIYDFSVCMWA